MMAKATIKSGTGATITIEGTPEEVKDLIASVERTVAPHSRTTEVGVRVANKPKADKKRESAADLVIALREENFFDKPRSLGEVSKALEEQGYLYPLTSLSGVVLSLLKRKELRRKKIDGKWMYGK